MKLEVQRSFKRRIAREKRAELRRELNPAASLQPRERTLRYDNVRSARAEEGVLRLLVKDATVFPDAPPLTEEQFSSPLLGRAFTTLWQAKAAGRVPSLAAQAEFFSQEEMKDFIESHNIPCPSCGKHNFTDIRQFNLMFKTFQGVTEDAKNTVYLRPETAQGIFVNFQNVQRTTRRKLPFGVCQIGKSFRNEITPGNFTFRTREFEQMELEFFCKPGTDLEWFQYWRSFCKDWLLGLNMREEDLRLRDHSPEELCFYSKGTTDFEFMFPFGWGELWGVADRTDYDLNQHQSVSGKDLTYFDPETNERYIPYVVEPSLGVERSVLAVLVDAYDEEVVDAEKNDVRVVLHLHPALAPYKAAVLPLSKKLSDKAREIYTELAKEWMIDFDETGSIGKRYRREDEVGTPYCITVDFDTVGDAEHEGDNCVTVRERDTMQQVRVPISELKSYLAEKLAY